MTNDTSVPDECTEASEKTATNTAKSIVTTLDDHAIRLDTTDPMADFRDLASLREVFADTRIIGLGEATHGTREFFRLKHRLLRYLVTECDVRVFGLEANFAETLAINNYVVNGEGDPQAALDGIYFWTWNVEAILELIEWLRGFNAKRDVDERVRFYGFDAQYYQGAVDALTEFFEIADPAFLETVREEFAFLADAGISPYQNERREERVETADRLAPIVRDRLHEGRETYVSRTSNRAWKLADQHVRSIERASELKDALHDHLEGNVDEEVAAERSLRVRDRTMAETVEWIMEHENADKMVIWAHDAHINRVEQISRQTGAAATSLGGHLAERYGDEYYAVGFSFGRGSFQALSEDPNKEGEDRSYSLQEQTIDAPLPDTIEATLSGLEYPIAFITIRTAREDESVAAWLADQHRHVSVGATYDPENPEEYITEYTYADAFDGVCYVDETTRARPIND